MLCCFRIEKQTLIELPKEQESRSLTNDEERRREEMTKQILEKIAEVNHNHGLKPKIIKHPSFYSAHKPHQLLQQEDKQAKQLPNFQFSNTPFTNPIFEYLQNQNNVKSNNFNTKTTLNEKDDEVPEGYAIKRKVTHQQTVIIPNYQQLPDPYQMQMPFGSVPMSNQINPMQQGGHYGLIPINEQNIPSPDMPNSEKTKHDQKNNSLDEITLAKQNYLINNIKNIISNTQNGAAGYPNPYGGYLPNPNPYYNPYLQPVMDPYSSYRINPFVNPYNPYVNPTQNQKFSDTYYANLQTEKEEHRTLDSSQNDAVESRQLQGPFSQYFPIVIKNPLQQMFQAITSMIEYGPAADLCRSHQGHDDIHRQVDEEIHRSQSTTRAGKAIDSTSSTTNLPNTKLENNTQNDDEFSIEGLQILDINKTKPSKNNSQNVENRQMDDDDDEPLIEEDKFFKKPEPVAGVQPVPMVPGNGIFIQKLKVRKGGVAIAGPGGIATAGSGGTAIVGPNGFAYTQPNGVAIAGPGSRVISVDPDVNLSEFVQNITKNGSVSRLGKLVAIGPIVYHNLGQN